jgi:hypothetical protein
MASTDDEERRLEDRIMAVANSFPHHDWCLFCDGYGYAFEPLERCPRATAAGHGRYMPRRMWTSTPDPLLQPREAGPEIPGERD